MLVSLQPQRLAVRLFRVLRVVVDYHVGMEACNGRTCGCGVTEASLRVLVVLFSLFVTSQNDFRKQFAELVALNDVL